MFYFYIILGLQPLIHLKFQGCTCPIFSADFNEGQKLYSGTVTSLS